MNQSGSDGNSKPLLGRQVLFIHVDIYAFGGAEIHCIRAMEALQGLGAKITLVHTGGGLDSALIESWCGIRLNPLSVKFITVPGMRAIARHVGTFALLQYAMAHAWARSLAPDYDLVATMFAECTIDHPCVVQYVQYPNFVVDRESLAHLGNHYNSIWPFILRVMYQRFCRSIARWNKQVVRSHVTLANSRWTARQFRRLYGDDAVVEPLYIGAQLSMPPGDPMRLAFNQRHNNFVIIGRVVPGKRVELAIEIVRRLRFEKKHDVGLHIIGRANGPYASSVRALIADMPWVRWHNGLSRNELERLVASQKWGLHCYPYEHYGIAPAELQMLGCITFVPDNGGQAEIVRSRSLRYDDANDAVEKIDYVLRHPDKYSALLGDIEKSNEIHRADHFATRYKEIILHILNASANTGRAQLAG